MSFTRLIFFILCFNIHQVQSSTLLREFNTLFSTIYQDARTYLLGTMNPIIIVGGDNLTLIHRGQQSSMVINHPLYHNLKSISHIPFAVYLRLFKVGNKDRTLSSAELMQLKSYLREVRRVRKSLNISDFLFDSDLFRLQFKIIDVSIKYLRTIIRSRQLNMTKLNEFCGRATKLFTKNVNRAARIQLDTVHSVVYPIYTNLFNETERNTVYIVLTGPKTPREGLLLMQYFEKLLGGKNLEGKRILYGENVDDTESALKILGTWFLDGHAAGAFFNDETRLHRDLLMDAAAEYIKNLLP